MASRTCWHCGNKTHLTRIGASYVVGQRRPEPGSDSADILAALFACDECAYPSIAVAARRHSQGGSAEDDDWLDGRTGPYEMPPDRLWLPQQPISKDFPDVPAHIADAASEAYSCHSIGAYRAAGALARAVVEATAKDKGVSSGTLYSKIEQLEQQGLLRPLVREAAHEIRHFGNEMAHGDLVEGLTEEATTETLALMGELLNEIYQVPARIARVGAARRTRAAKPSE
ncbi:hypothetical protein GCM10009616_08110 [Microlunatus lacustris]